MANDYFFYQEKLKPMDLTINRILVFSRALSTIKSEVLNEQIVYFKN